MTRHYSDPTRANDAHALPDVEVFTGWHADCQACDSTLIDIDGEGTDCAECGARNGEGTDDAPDLTWSLAWWWWSCFPGCLPDSEPNGPFATEAEALDDAQASSGDDEPDGDLPGVPRNSDGKFPAYAWPGGYPVYYLCADDGVLCPACANGENGSDARVNTDDPQWKLVAAVVHWEGAPFTCDHCNAEIESAYGDPDAENDAQNDTDGAE